MKLILSEHSNQCTCPRSGSVYMEARVNLRESCLEVCSSTIYDEKQAVVKLTFALV